MFKAPIFLIVLLFCLFIIWKRLREDYADEQIFSFSFLVSLAGLLGFSLSYFTFPNLTLWNAILGTLLAAISFSKRFSMRFFETLEAITPAILLILLTISVTGLRFSGWSVLSLVEPIVNVFLLLLFVYVSRNFRKFLWYPSGKLGLASLMVLAFWGFGRAVLANFSPGVLTFSDRLADSAFGTAGGILALFVIYIRSGREFGFPKYKFFRVR